MTCASNGCKQCLLHGDLSQEIYMTLPDGVTAPMPNRVCKLHKSLYGLKQASREWNIKLTQFLLSQGCVQSKHYYTMFTQRTSDAFLVLLVYVDDIIVASNSFQLINQLKNTLHQTF